MSTINLIFADPIQGPDAPLPMDVKARDLLAGDLVWLAHLWSRRSNAGVPTALEVGNWAGHWCSIVSIHPLFGDKRLNLHVRHTDGTHREVTVCANEFAQIRRYF